MSYKERYTANRVKNLKIDWSDDTTWITTYYLSDEKQNECVYVQRAYRDDKIKLVSNYLNKFM